MAQRYSNPKRENDPHALPDLEVFYVSPAQASNRVRRYANSEEGDDCTEPGWYWWSCFPGCLPDGDPYGPFDTEAAALDDARGSIAWDSGDGSPDDTRTGDN